MIAIATYFFGVRLRRVPWRSTGNVRETVLGRLEAARAVASVLADFPVRVLWSGDGTPPMNWYLAAMESARVAVDAEPVEVPAPTSGGTLETWAEALRAFAGMVGLKTATPLWHLTSTVVRAVRDGCSSCGKTIRNPSLDGRRIWMGAGSWRSSPSGLLLVPDGLPWRCQVCAGATCRTCGAPLQYPSTWDVLDDDGSVLHAPFVPTPRPPCINPRCPAGALNPGAASPI
jgi:hypothetical protein